MTFFKSKENLGISFAALAYFSFALLDTTQKFAVIYYSIFQIMLIKYFFLLFLSISESKRKKNYNFWKSSALKLQLYKSVLSILETICFVLSFRYLSLAEVHSIGSLSPIIVVALSVIILREKVSASTWVAVFVSFIGVLIILRPGMSIFDYKSLIPLIGAFFFGLYQILLKKVSRYDSNETSIFFTALIGICFTSILSFYFWESISYFFMIIFILIGFFFAIGNYFQIIALSLSRASIIQPFHYTLVFWAVVFGYLFYNDIPDLPTIVGAIIIAISGIYIFSSKNQSKEK